MRSLALEEMDTELREEFLQEAKELLETSELSFVEMEKKSGLSGYDQSDISGSPYD